MSKNIVIAFSGPGNTGKTTAIENCQRLYGDRGLKAYSFDEIARRDFDPSDSIYEIQEKVLAGEFERQENLGYILSKGEYDFILVDRPWRDGMVYVEWNRKLDKISDEEYQKLMLGYEGLKKFYGAQYDIIISAYEPIKPTSNPKFLHYNSNSLNRLFAIETKMQAKCPILKISNGKKENVYNILQEHLGL